PRLAPPAGGVQTLCPPPWEDTGLGEPCCTASTRKHRPVRPDRDRRPRRAKSHDPAPDRASGRAVVALTASAGSPNVCRTVRLQTSGPTPGESMSVTPVSRGGAHLAVRSDSFGAQPS